MIRFWIPMWRGFVVSAMGVRDTFIEVLDSLVTVLVGVAEMFRSLLIFLFNAVTLPLSPFLSVVKDYDAKLMDERGIRHLIRHIEWIQTYELLDEFREEVVERLAVYPRNRTYKILLRKIDNKIERMKKSNGY